MTDDAKATQAKPLGKATKPSKDNRNRDLKVRHKAEGVIRYNRLTATRAHPIPGYAVLEEARILHDIIKPELLDEEPGVQDSRWPEYGYTSAFQADEAYTRAYVEAYPKLRERYIDSDAHPCPVDPEFARNDPGTMNALHGGRLFADYLGMPYQAFIVKMGHTLMTTGMYRRVPLPNHFYPAPDDENSKALRHALRFRDVTLEARSSFTPDWPEQLRARNYCGHPAQDRALRFMAEYPSKGGQSRLAHWMSNGWISPEQAQRLFKPAVFEAAIERVGAICPMPKPTEGLAPYRPHCFGLHRAGVQACASCPWATKCEDLALRAARQQLALTGYTNRAERDRMAARDRQRAKRQRDRDEKVHVPTIPVADTVTIPEPAVQPI